MKLLVFIYAAVLAGLSGWLYAHFQRAANPTPFGGASRHRISLHRCGRRRRLCLGRRASVPRSSSFLKEILQSYLPLLLHGEGQLETIVFGLLLVVLLQLAPAGVWPWLMSLWPFEPRRRPPDTSLAFARLARAPAETPNVLLEVSKARKQFGRRDRRQRRLF